MFTRTFFLAFFLLAATCLKGTIYLEPTSNFKPKIAVACLYIEHEGRILMLHRKEDTSQGNRWGIPGGKIDKKEPPLQAVIREVKEETGFDFSDYPIEDLGTVYIEYNDKDHFTYHTYRVHFDGDPSAVKINFKEHKGFTWVTPQDALKYELIEDEDACFKLHYGLQ